MHEYHFAVGWKGLSWTLEPGTGVLLRFYYRPERGTGGQPCCRSRSRSRKDLPAALSARNASLHIGTFLVALAVLKLMDHAVAARGQSLGPGLG
jgi:hypothetical protein